MTVFVLDNSVTMRWFFDGAGHARADAILGELMKVASEAIVPVLWRYEVSAVLARACIRGSIPVREAEDFIRDLEALPIRLDQECDQRIFSDVHQLAVASRLTSYDAAYLELAQRRGLPLATFDADLITACHRAGVALV